MALRWSILFVLGLLIYGQTFHFGFVFDDQMFIIDNANIRSFSHTHLMFQSFPMTRLIGIYSFALNYFLNKLNPQGYHIFNFIVHMVAVGLVWALADLLFKITKSLPSQDRLTKELPFIIAVFFLVHPCQTQAVSYISQRYESMATVFYLATMYSYLSARLSKDRARQIILFGLSGLFSILGIFTKEVIITVPAMILASEWILFPKNTNKKIYAVLILAGGLLYALLSKMLHAGAGNLLQTIPSESHLGDSLTPAHYFLTQLRVYLTFLRLLVFPIHQNVDYDYPVSTGFLHPPLTLAGLCAVGCTIFLINRLRRKLPLIAWGLAWVLITFSINLVPRANLIFEHKLYLISFGFFLAFVPALSLLVPNRGTLMRTLLCLIAVLAFVSFQRNKVWKNQFTLWNDVIQKSPYKARPYNNRGMAWAQKGNLNQALSDYNKAVQMDPHYINVYINRGSLYNTVGDFTRALSDYNKAIELAPDLAGAYINRGNTYTAQGNFTQALTDYDKAIGLNQNTAEAYTDRGNVYFKQRNFIQAISDYNKAITLKPNVDAYYNLGFIYYKQGNWAQAISNFSEVLEINPKDTETCYNRAVCYYQLKEYDKAWDDVQTAEKFGSAVNPELIRLLHQATGRIN